MGHVQICQLFMSKMKKIHEQELRSLQCLGYHEIISFVLS